MLVAACARHDRAAPAADPAGSGSTAAVAVVHDAAPPDAPATDGFTRQCAIQPPGAYCKVSPRGGAWYGKHCWRVVVAIEARDKPAVREVVSQPACAGYVAPTGYLDLDFTFAPKDDPSKPCAPDDACELELVVDDARLGAEIKRLHERWLDALVQDRHDREEAAHDKEVATNVDWKKVFEHFVALDVEYYVEHDHVAREEAERSVRDNGGIEMNLPQSVLDKATNGQIRCALEASTPDSFRDCFKPDDDGATGPANDGE